MKANSAVTWQFSERVSDSELSVYRAALLIIIRLIVGTNQSRPNSKGHRPSFLQGGSPAPSP